MTRLAVGTFTDGFMGGAPGEGIYLIELADDHCSGSIVSVLGGLHSPSYLAKHPFMPLLYAAERAWSGADKTHGALSTLQVDQGGLTLIDRRSSGGAFSAHVAVAPDANSIMLANPLGPSIAAFPLDSRGLPGDPAVEHFAGRGPRPRQSAPWPHSSWYAPSGKWAFACDLGLDTIAIYTAEKGLLPLRRGPFPAAQVSSGAGARHMAIRPDGRFAYIANELDGTISVFALDEELGTLTIVQTLPCAAAACQPCEIVCDVAGEVLYVSLRGPEAIAAYRIDKDTGRLAPIHLAPCLGNTPRHIALSPDGRTLIACNQLSGEIVGMTIDSEGVLTPNGLRISIPSPSCAVFL